jgi:hypothetical protein
MTANQACMRSSDQLAISKTEAASWKAARSTKSFNLLADWTCDNVRQRSSDSMLNLKPALSGFHIHDSYEFGVAHVTLDLGI